jgi:hypothetical protein
LLDLSFVGNSLPELFDGQTRRGRSGRYDTSAPFALTEILHLLHFEGNQQGSYFPAAHWLKAKMNLSTLHAFQSCIWSGQVQALASNS